MSGSRSINLEFTDNTPINVELRVTSESGVVFTYKVPVILPAMIVAFKTFKYIMPQRMNWYLTVLVKVH